MRTEIAAKNDQTAENSHATPGKRWKTPTDYPGVTPRRLKQAETGRHADAGLRVGVGMAGMIRTAHGGVEPPWNIIPAMGLPRPTQNKTPADYSNRGASENPGHRAGVWGGLSG